MPTSTTPPRPSVPGDGAVDDVVDAVRRHLAAVPDVRPAVVAAARERLRTVGPPSAAALADMLVDAIWPRSVTDPHGSAHLRLC